jgi:hypothetical protein
MSQPIRPSSAPVAAPRVPAPYPPMVDDESEEEPVPRRKRPFAAVAERPLHRLGGGDDSDARVDGLSLLMRTSMKGFVEGKHVLDPAKQIVFTAPLDPEAVSWEEELKLERRQAEVSETMRMEVFKGLETDAHDHEFTMSERAFVKRVFTFTSSVLSLVHNLTRAVYEKGHRGALVMQRKHDDTATFDRKLLRRDLRAEKLQTDKAVGVGIVHTLYEKLIDARGELGTANARNAKKLEKLEAANATVLEEHCEQIAALEARHTKQLKEEETLVEEHCEQIAALEARHTTQLKEEEVRYTKRFEELEAANATLVGEHCEQIAALEARHTKQFMEEEAHYAKRFEELECIMRVVEHGSCMHCKTTITGGYVMDCKGVVCEDCEAHLSCSCQITRCEPAYPITMADTVRNIRWVKQCIITSFEDGVEGASTDITKAVDEYLSTEFETRMLAQRRVVAARSAFIL